MKKTITTIFFICLTLSAFSQGKERREQIKALKVAHITEALSLTETEAQKFWPIYNAHEKEMHMLRRNAKEKRRGLEIENITEAEAKQAIKDFLAFEKEQQNLETDLIENLLTAIPAKKIILLHIAEEDFKRKLFEQYKKRRLQNKKNK